MPFPLFPLPSPVPTSLRRAPLLRSSFSPSIVFLSFPSGFARSSLRLPFRFTPLYVPFLLFVSLPASYSFLPLRVSCLCSVARLACLPSLLGLPASLVRLAYLACLPAFPSRFSLRSTMRASSHPSSLCQVVRTILARYAKLTNESTPSSPQRDRGVTSRVTSSPLFLRRYLTPWLPLSSRTTFLHSSPPSRPSLILFPLCDRRNDPLVRVPILCLLL